MIAVSVTGQSSLAEDAIQDALLACLRSTAKPEAPMAYLSTAVRNAALRLRLKHPVSEDTENALTWVAHEDDKENAYFAMQVNRALAALPSNQRETLILHIYGGMSFREIAELGGHPLNTVASWYRRALKHLRRSGMDE